jgi:hypothetical protein
MVPEFCLALEMTLAPEPETEPEAKHGLGFLWENWDFFTTGATEHRENGTLALAFTGFLG